MDGNNPGLMRFLGDLVLVMAPIALCGYYLRNYMDVINGPKDLDNSKVGESIRKAYAHWLKTHPGEDFPVFDEYEKYIMGDMVFSEDVNTSLSDIGGQDDTLNSLMESVILPLRNPELFQRLGHEYGGEDNDVHMYSTHTGGGHELLRAPLGVLLAGPPGTGKTLTARALAKESGAVFISASPSMLQSKWHGESEKLVRALFSVARKMSPSIVFIDEIDVFLAQRGGGAHEVTSRLTGEFLAQWDGIQSGGSRPGSVVVIGATNRAFDLDEAVLRRMPRQIYFKLPDKQQRVEIVKVVMGKIAFDACAEYGEYTGRNAAYQYIADHTEGYSGSDIKEACRFAAQVPISEFVRTQREALRSGTISVNAGSRPRLMSLNDLVAGLNEVKRTGQQAEEYRESMQGNSADELAVLKSLFTKKEVKKRK